VYANQGDWHGVPRVLPRAARPHGSTWPHEKIASAAPTVVTVAVIFLQAVV